MKHYFVNDALFFYEQASGILRMPAVSLAKKHSEVFIREATEVFDLYLDVNGTLHGVYQDQQNALVYFRDANDAHFERVLLNSRNLIRPFGEIRLVAAGKLLHVFFLMRSSKGTMLVHQKISESLSGPEVIDYTVMTPDAYDVLADSDGNIILLYQNKDRLLCQKTYQSKKRAWSEQKMLTEEAVRFPALLNNRGEIYVVYLINQKSMLMLGGMDEKPRPIFAPFEPSKKPLFLSDGDRITVFWCQDKGLFSLSVLENGTIEPLVAHKVYRAVIYPLTVLSSGNRQTVFCHILGDRIHELSPRCSNSFEAVSVPHFEGQKGTKNKSFVPSITIQKLRLQNEMLLSELRAERQKNASLHRKIALLQKKPESSPTPLPADSPPPESGHTDLTSSSD